MLTTTVKSFSLPTKTPEADGTLSWNKTTLVTVELTENAVTGLGYTYADEATAHFLVEHALPVLRGLASADHFRALEIVKKKFRNLSNAGVSSLALSALDIAFWDLRARLLGISFADLLGKKRDSVPFYGSGLFMNLSEEELKAQIESFRILGCRSFKMKIGAGYKEDLERVALVRSLVGEDAALFVDANGAYDPRTGLALAFELPRFGVSWFEEPVTSDDDTGMRFLRDHFPPSVRFVAGEYCHQDHDFLRLLARGLVDVIQVDATRSEGVTGALRASALAHAFNVPLSTHCAPLLSGNLGLVLDQLSIAEGFIDHLRLEEECFEHLGQFVDGAYYPGENQLGFGWELSPRAKGHMTYEHAA